MHVHVCIEMSRLLSWLALVLVQLSDGAHIHAQKP